MRNNSSFGTCRNCGKRIVWIRTAAGKNMPCNPELISYKALSDGKERIVTPDGEVVAAEKVERDGADGIGYISHFATCPRHKR